MIPVEEALDRLFALAPAMPVETVALRHGAGRVLARPLAARRDQPPFAASAMDGYAVLPGDGVPGATLQVIGESAAGARSDQTLRPGTAIRIFTGAPVPDGTDRIVLQEDVTRDGDRIVLGADAGRSVNIRASGTDFRSGDTVHAPRLLTPADLALLAAMNHPELPVARRPVVAILATGDELVQPGGTPGPDQIISSNGIGLAAMAETAGAEARLLPVAPDDLEMLRAALDLCAGADLILTIGGASVGDHDLIGAATHQAGMQRSFWKVAMRPGKPLIAGRLNDALLLGLPGNPVSALVCATVFVLPVLRAMQGLPASLPRAEPAILTGKISANGPRTHFMRARLGADGVQPFPSQDSSLLTVLAEANCLIVRAPGAPSAEPGTQVEVIRL